MSAPESADSSYTADEVKALREEAMRALADFKPDVMAMYDELLGIDSKKADQELHDALKPFFEEIL